MDSRLAPAALAALLAASTPLASSGDSMRLQVRATILPFLQVRTVHQPASLEVSAADAMRGYVRVRDALDLRLRTNSDAPVSLRVASNHPVAESVTIESLETPLENRADGPDGVSLRGVRRAGDAPVRASVKVLLAPGTAAGTYPWPAFVSLGGV